MRILSLLPLLAAVTGGISHAQDIRVLTFDSSRSRTCQSLDFNLVQGNAFSVLRSWLTDANRFGSSGVIPRSVTFVPQVPMITPSALATADVVLLPPMKTTLLRCEVLELEEFILQGGGVFAFANNAVREFNAVTGATYGGGGTYPFATVVDPTSPVANGPFGAVSGAVGQLQYHQVYSDLGPNGNAILSTSDPVLAEFVLGAGRLVTFGDEEWVSNGFVGGCALGQQPETVRETLWLNAFASVTPSAGFQYVPNPVTIGTTYCGPANVNSRNLPATICALGSASVADNDVTLLVDWVATNAFGFFLVSNVQDFVPFPAGSQGNLCLANPVGRIIGPNQVQDSGSGGRFTLALDLTQLPQPTGFVAVQAGETWNFQAWYRDANPSSTSNFSDALSLTFQ